MSVRKIASAKNAIVKEAVRLRRKRNRQDRKLFMAEGEDLLEAAVTSGIIPRQVFVLDEDDELQDRISETVMSVLPPGQETEFYTCNREVMEKLSMLGGGSRVAAVFSFIDHQLTPETKHSKQLPLIYLAGISDPGNLGTIVRSAAALGAAGVMLDPDTADPYSPKAIRASMGALFSTPLYTGVSVKELIQLAKRLGRGIICADSTEGAIAWEVDLSDPFILILGSERTGIPGSISSAAVNSVRIPQYDRKVDSINVAMAASAILYEASRQRSAL